MRLRGVPLLPLLGALICGGAADKPVQTASEPKPSAKAASKDGSDKDAAPACMHCGATCGLRPVCVCKPGTKKQPRIEFDTKCEPICIPGCGGFPWLLRHRGAPAGCTSCCDARDCCPGTMRYCNRLQKETVDEEKAVIERKVAYVCRPCQGGGTIGCCGSEPPRPQRAWWPSLPWWWPRPATGTTIAP